MSTIPELRVPCLIPILDLATEGLGPLKVEVGVLKVLATYLKLALCCTWDRLGY